MSRLLPITIKVPSEMLEELDRIARALGRSRSDLVREGIEYIIAKYGHALYGMPRYVASVIDCDVDPSCYRQCMDRCLEMGSSLGFCLEKCETDCRKLSW